MKITIEVETCNHDSLDEALALLASAKEELERGEARDQREFAIFMEFSK